MSKSDYPAHAVTGILFLLALVMLFCTTLLRSLVQAQTAVAEHKKTVAARTVAEGVIRIIRALYAVHTKEIRSACVTQGESLSLVMSEALMSSLTFSITPSRIIAQVFYVPGQQNIVADIQIVREVDIPYIHLQVLLDTVDPAPVSL